MAVVPYVTPRFDGDDAESELAPQYGPLDLRTQVYGGGLAHCHSLVLCWRRLLTDRGPEYETTCQSQNPHPHGKDSRMAHDGASFSRCSCLNPVSTRRSIAV